MTEDQQPESNEPKDVTPSGLTAFWKELRRRHVVRVAITYAVVAWLIIQIAASTFEGFGIPDWAFRFVVIMVILGFPIAVLLAWAFELTPEGIKTTKTAKVQHPDSHEDKSHVKKRHWFSLGMAAAVPTLIFGVLAAFFYIQNRSLVSNIEAPVPDPVFEVEENDKSIAVLPLENMSPDPNNAFFADGVHEDILTNLSKIKEMGVVISRSSTLKYRDPDRNLKQVGQELGVRYIVEGSVRRAANQVRVTVQLIDSQTDDHLWAENYDRSLDNIFAIQAEIAKEISKQLHAVLSPEEIEQIEIRPTKNQEAYDLYLRARNLDITPRPDVGPLLEKAVALDPQFYRAWAELASWGFQRWNNNSGRQDAELYTKGQQAFEKLKSLAPQSPELLIVQSTFADEVENDLVSSIDYGIKARLKGLFEKDLGYRYLKLGKLDEAQLYLEELIRKEPFQTADNQRLFHVYTLKKMWREVEALIERNLELRGGGEISNQLLFWQERASYLDFIKTGNKRAFKIDENGTDLSDVRGRFLSSILLRNLKNSLGDIEEFSGSSINLTAGRVNPPSLYGWRIGPTNLVGALLYFELGEKNSSLEYAEKAASYLEKSVNGSNKIRPYDLANLTICYALNQDREKVESTIPRIRELTEDVNWKFREQVSCEMKIAVAYLVLGDHDKAIETLEAASEMDGPIFLNRELDLWFIFDRLRGDPRFDALLEG